MIQRVDAAEMRSRYRRRFVWGREIVLRSASMLPGNSYKLLIIFLYSILYQVSFRRKEDKTESP